MKAVRMIYRSIEARYSSKRDLVNASVDWILKGIHTRVGWVSHASLTSKAKTV